MITFIEHEHTGYPLRTRDNAMATDGTIAFAVNWKSSGMILTHKCCYGAGKLYIKLDLNDYYDLSDKQAIEIAAALKERNVNSLNIAGNSMPHLRGKYTQEGINAKIADCMDKITAYWPVKLVSTGGQGGVDLAGSIWADNRGIESIVLAPKGWMYRDDAGRDICNEYGFIKRFGEAYDMGDIL